MSDKKFILYTDGGARGNPGPAGIGVVLIKDKTVIWQEGRYIGETTNNQAEYQALILGLGKAKSLKVTELECRLDSELVVKQMKRQYKVRDTGLAPLFVKAWNLCQSFQKISFHHIPRGQNKKADALVNQVLDKAV